MPPKQLSGAQNRKEKLKREEDARKCSGPFVNYFKNIPKENILYNSLNNYNYQSAVSREKDNLKLLFDNLYKTVLFLIENNFPFETPSGTPVTEGNFFTILKNISESNTAIQEYLRRMAFKSRNLTYCIDRIQDQVLSLMSSAVRDVILNRAKESKYFSVILNWSLDRSEFTALSFQIRYVNISNSDVKIEESFISYEKIDIDRDGRSMPELFMDLLKKYDLDIRNCRGQGYDNWTHTKGRNQQVQKRIRVENPRAFLLPCSCHSLNVVIYNSMIECMENTLFAYTYNINKLFKFFSGWTQRWKILLDNVTNFTLKPLPETNWESRIECLELLKYQIVNVKNALTTLGKIHDSQTNREVSNLSEILCDLSFLTFVSMWYDVLKHVNVINQAMQSKTIDLESLMSLLKSCIEYLTDYRVNGFEKAKNEGIELTQLLDAKPIFVDHRFCKGADEKEFDAEEYFRIQVFDYVLEIVLDTLNERLQQIDDFQKTWGFLFNSKKFSLMDGLKERCSRLELILTDGDNLDIDGSGLYEEIQSFFKSKTDCENSPIDILNFIKMNVAQETFPNLWIALRILLTLPVMVASCEQSCSKLELIKSHLYLQPVLSKDCLDSLSVLSIEFDIAQKLDTSSIKETFANSKFGK